MLEVRKNSVSSDILSAPIKPNSNSANTGGSTSHRYFKKRGLKDSSATLPFIDESHRTVECDNSASSRTSTDSDGNGCLKIRSQKDSLVQEFGSATKPNSVSRKVGWGKIELHEHEIMLGDNPATSFGPPVSLGWNRVDSNKLSIDDYESHRPDRRDRADLVIPNAIREQLLMENGYSRGEIKERLQLMTKIKQSRIANARYSMKEKVNMFIRRRKNAVNCIVPSID